MADDKPKNADFIGRVVKDAKNPVETRMLSGWFGDSGEKGTRRLYCDAELTSYFDIPDDAILYTEPIKDSQPAGGTLVWIKRDAAVQSGGSSASRAGRFLQGQVATDFGAPGSLEKAGLRCVTEVPCGEPTGFTGQCTKQPNVGGAWPCITAVPLCVEVTGFTGKCTYNPWPHPTRYIGCTILHCPTNDLTHIPHICNIVASGQPGCVVVNPPQGGEVEKNAAVGASEKVAETALPGCGYTKTWGLCETHLLGCGYTQTWGLCPTRPELCDPAGPQANAFAADARAVNIAISAQACMSPVPCSDFVACTQFCSNQTKAPTELCTPAPKVCDTFCGPNCQTKQVQPICTSVNCVTPAGHACPPPSQPPLCPPQTATSGPIACCVQPQQQFAQQAVAAPQTLATVCTQFGTQCPTQPRGDCTFFGCPHTHSGPGCPPTPATVCTQFAPCPTHHIPCVSPGIDCTAILCTHFGPQCPSRQFECTMFCTHGAPGCPTPLCPEQRTGVQCFQPPHTSPPQCPILTGFNCPSQICHSLGCVSQACQPQGGIEQPQQRLAQQAVGGPQTLATVCTQLGCPTYPNGDCTFFGGCGHTQPNVCRTHHLPCPTGGIDCTVIVCTHIGPGCPPTPATVCTQPIHHCNPSAVDACPTRVCTQLVHCNPSAIDACPTRLGCPTQNPQQCPPASGFNCPSGFCQSIACQSQACQPGGGGIEQQRQAQFVAAPAQFPTVVVTCFVCTGIPCHTIYLRCPILP